MIFNQGDQPPPPYYSSNATAPGAQTGSHMHDMHMPTPNVAGGPSFPAPYVDRNPFRNPSPYGNSSNVSGSGGVSEPPPPPAAMRTPETKSSGHGIQLTRDAQVLIQTYLPGGTAIDEKERLREYYEQQDKLQHGQTSSTWMPTQTQAAAASGDALPLPLCIPQISISARFDSAFARGYNETLERVDISAQTLLDFIDGLNLAIVASPPLRVVDAVGQALGFVPFHWAMIAGIVLQTTAQTGMRVLSKTLTDRYLRAANLRLFKPRGLSVRLCTTPAMLALIQKQTQLKTSGKGKTKETLDKVGRTVGTVLLHAPLPLSSRIVRAIADKPPLITPAPGESTENVVLRRRLALVSPPGPELALSLRMQGLPAPKKPEGIMEMINQWGLKWDGHKESKKERQNEQRRRALQRIDETFATQGGSAGHGHGGRPTSDLLGARPSSSRPTGRVGSHSSSSGSFDMRMVGQALSDRQEARQARKEYREVRREVKKRYKSERKEARRQWKDDRRARKGLPSRRGGLISGLVSEALGPRETPMQRRVANADLLEHWSNDDVLWIVIMKDDADREIEGIEFAESLDDEEHVRPEVWNAEMELERENLKEALDDSDSDSSSSSDSEHKRRV
ncbi:hypothetical protein D9758_017209 [Tetrapyrgos nigripes]|uniref:Uncharacterized protein n=1 Tax=Tetrapyrgos nigripes TaxID=182062 RepID=A0A8H5C131_9AGAR|nr:hypothetical protein D9758_017209 [Tetrapyrgos nigripes]